MANLLLLNGPNLNLLGTREPEVYGHTTLAEIESDITALAERDGHRIECFQSNAEHELVERIHQAPRAGIDCAIINPGAFTHTSVAIRDAFLATDLPFIEIHISNIHQRERFRRRSYLSDVAAGVIVGLGPTGYRLAYQAALSRLPAQS